MILRRGKMLRGGDVVRLELPSHGIDTWTVNAVETLGEALFLKLEAEEGFYRAVELRVSDMVEIVPD